MLQFQAIGNLTKDAEPRQVNDRFAIGLSLAINRKYKDNEYSTFLNLTYWTKSDKIVQYLKKGKKISVVGDWYENKKDDNGNYWQTFTVRELQLLSPIENASGSNGNNSNSEDNTKDTYNTMGVEKSENKSTKNDGDFNPFDDEDDDLPF